MPRGQFVALSGALGAGALLAGAAGSAFAPARPPPGSGGTPGCPCPAAGARARRPRYSPSAVVPRTPTCSTARRGRDIVPPSGHKADCLKTAPHYVVLHGEPVSTHNYQTVPACRITGIECPFLLNPNVANHWYEAWEKARRGGDVAVQHRDIGLGINSQSARQLNQLHIHMSGVRDSTQQRLQALDAAGRVATHPSQWGDTQYQAPVTGTGGDRTYRILQLPALTTNLFALPNMNVVRPFGLQTSGQPLMVVPRLTPTAFDGAFDVLNSDASLLCGRPGSAPNSRTRTRGRNHPLHPARRVYWILCSQPGLPVAGLALVVQGKTPHFPWGNAGARPAQRSIRAPVSSQRPGPFAVPRLTGRWPRRSPGWGGPPVGSRRRRAPSRWAEFTVAENSRSRPP
ncbi:CDP-diacylglycerol diphosphatase [Streptomyces sp. NPDC059104]|uniref:CDP-diacylglycerol diphosphatase n=1 Tax=Streptomyces sp. NPDC059104 TaxID=3346729 RepID=UPI00368310C4